MLFLKMFSAPKNVEIFKNFYAGQKSLLVRKKLRWTKNFQVVKGFLCTIKLLELQICSTPPKILQDFKSLKYPKTFGGSKNIAESEKFLTLSSEFQGKYVEVTKYFRRNQPYSL